MSPKVNTVRNGNIITSLLEPDERFVGGKSTGLEGATILDYWRWAFSGIVGNTDRGNMAEYIVAKAIKASGEVRNDWENYDLITPDGIKVETKSSAYVQAWKQNRPSPPIFSIKKTLPTWDFTSTFKQRYADVYVFCLLAYTDKETVNPMDAGQWEFYIIHTDELNRDLPDAKTISLREVRRRSRLYTLQDLSRGLRSVMGRT